MDHIRGQGQYVDEHSKQIYVNHRLVVILVVLTRTQLVFSLFISHLLAKAIPVRGAILEKPAQGNLSGLFAFGVLVGRLGAKSGRLLCKCKNSQAVRGQRSWNRLISYSKPEA